MAINTSERQFESDIEAAFLKEGYRQVSPTLYDATNAVFPEILKEFIDFIILNKCLGLFYFFF